MITEEQFKAKDESLRKKGFDDFMRSPPIRLLLSMIPAGSHPEAISTLLEEAYSKGWSSGQGTLSIMMLERIMKGPFRE